MPIWPVSFVDGSYQVADADGAFYPITMVGEPMRHFNPGWGPRGLQTGLPPFHVLELEHDGGGTAYWMLDTALDFQANAASALPEAQRTLFLEHVGPLVRNLFDDAVRAPHAAVPAAAHNFEGFRIETVLDLLGVVIPTVPGRPDVVSTALLEQTGGTYVGNGISLSSGWISQVLQARTGSDRLSVPSPGEGGAPVVSQERLSLLHHAADRFLDRTSGLVFYLLQGAAADDRHLYVPAAAAVFTRNGLSAGHDPLLLLLTYYATHLDRAVLLPEIEGLEPGLVHVVPPPQAGLDEPAVVVAPEQVEPARQPEPEPEPEPVHVVVAVHEEAAAPGAWMPVDMPSAAPSRPVPRAAAPGLRQNWWQRLLGLGH